MTTLNACIRPFTDSRRPLPLTPTRISLPSHRPEKEADDKRAWRQAAQWELLFQAIDCIHDCSLYYMIRRKDLLARRSERAWFCLQCT
jgi:hypothetical protein